MKRIVVGMSGGLDSSVAAALLVEQGYDVIGVTIKTSGYEDSGRAITGETNCCSIDGVNDARRVCTALGIPHYIYDFTERFREEIIDPFIDAYLSGETPNPCVQCNRSIKWSELLRRARALGAEAVATGHYARLRHDEATGRSILSRGLDRSKDQSYALWAVRQESLARTVFPLAELTKPESRAIAERLGLPVANKRESYELCFIPDNDYGRFLRDEVPGLADRVSGGEFVRADGTPVGRHDGYPFYTVGQRRGIGIAAPEPLYVIDIESGSNRVVVGGAGELMHRGLRARGVNMGAVPDLTEPRRLHAHIRHRDEGATALCRTLDGGDVLEVIFDEPRRAIARGQSVVLYDGDDLVAGGVIFEAFEPEARSIEPV